MEQGALEKKLLTALLSELELEENRVERLKTLFRDPNFHQEMDEAILSYGFSFEMSHIQSSEGLSGEATSITQAARMLGDDRSTI
ncbi:MAG: hypothetical protein AAGD09_09915 [Cyanobacteria bacterium P01_F01_bin.56]